MSAGACSTYIVRPNEDELLLEIDRLSVAPVARIQIGLALTVRSYTYR
jgi:hypothetical protein